MTRKINRRVALTALGAGATVAALGAGQRSLRAAEGVARYFIGVYMPHGMAREYWVPGPGFDITYPNCSLAPFADERVLGKSYASSVVALEGLDLTAGIEGGTAGHDASRALLTGSAQQGRGASLDQFLAIERGLGRDTPLASLVLGVGSAEVELGHCISYAKGGVALPKLIDPSQTFAQAFAELVVGTDPVALAKSERDRKLGKSLLDAWREDLASLREQSPASEREKLEQHASALRELEKRLSAPALSDCSPPDAPDASRFPRLLGGGGGEPYFDTITDLQIDLLAHAMGCGITHVGTLFLADLTRTQLEPDLPEDIHIGVAHEYVSGGREGGGNPATWLPLARQNRYTYSKLARLVSRLDEHGILEQTALIALSDLGDPNGHRSRQVPTILAGGWGGRLSGGRHIDLGAEGTPHNRLLVSVQQAFGVDSESFGEAEDPSITSGALDLG